VTSSAVSWFDPVTVERLVELVSIRGRVGAVSLRSAAGLPIFRGTACGLAALGALADGPKVDDLSHAMFDVFGICDGPQVRPTAIRAKCADTVTRLAECLTRTGTPGRIEAVSQ
jgi:hypothetical protein